MLSKLSISVEACLCSAYETQRMCACP